MNFETNIQANDKEIVYEAPAIIYEGEITTRAGSPFSAPGADVTVEDLFGSE